MTLLDRLGGRRAIRQGVEDTFRLLSRHPHPSHGEALTCGDYAAFLREKLGGNPVEDHVHNLLCPLPATPGREGRPRLILQGHMDMVCAAAGDFQPERDPVTIVAKDGFLRSDGRSSLGADNGLGNAAVLWLLSTGQVAHGPLTLLFTTAEEVGLAGAKEVDPAWLAGSDYLLNTDGFHLGRAIVGSASGRRETWSRPLELE
ncbi:M28 family peptidase, partial [Pseudoflavonifractor phocaeensis]|uniref:M28 family peptidase n=1 Tax=Pseudoflavonifractor phocaeensis TaxID=1870988 RepID=UPI00195D8D93